MTILRGLVKRCIGEGMYDEGVDHKCVYTRIDQEGKFFNFEEKNYYERARAPNV